MNEEKENIQETEEIGSSARELIKPENIVGVFTSTTKEMLNYLLSDKED